MGIIIGLILFLFVPICILLTLIILLQDSKGEGLSSSAFGAAEVQSVLGGRGAATFLGKLTTWLAIAFMLIALFLMRFYGENIEATPLTPIEQETTQESTAEPADTTDGENVETPTEPAETTDEENAETPTEPADTTGKESVEPPTTDTGNKNANKDSSETEIGDVSTDKTE